MHTSPSRARRTPALLALALAAAGTASALVPAVPATAAAPAERVVVTAAADGAAGVAAAARAVTAAGGRVLDRLPVVGGVSAVLPAGAVLAPSYAVAPDRPVRVATGGAAATGPASTVRATLGLGAPAGEGRGVTVAVVDTGVADVPDLAGRVTHVDVSGAGTGDGYGHGTFVAGLVAGDGTSSGGAYAGVAPAARVLDVRVAADDGATDLVTVLRGLQAAADRDVDVVNLSLTADTGLPHQLDPLVTALETLWRRGTTVVVPAGNDGPGAGTVASPGTSPVLLTVGSLHEQGGSARGDDTVSAFSAVGPAPQGVAKPDLVAPGQSLVSLRAPGSLVDREHGAAAGVGTAYFRGSGTSFATAVTAGAAAALLAQRPLSPDRVKATLTGTAYAAPGLADRDAAGAGGLDLAAALAAKPLKARGPARPDAAPGDARSWEALAGALVDGDPDAAGSAWQALPRGAQAWAQERWAELDADVRAYAVAAWTDRGWSGATAEQWALRDWAARTWSAEQWSGRMWSGRMWSGRMWSEDDWAGRMWSGRMWSGRMWSGRMWSGRMWSGDDWAGRMWSSAVWGSATWR